MGDIWVILTIILIVALGVSLGLWLVRHISVDVDYNSGGSGGGFAPQGC